MATTIPPLIDEEAALHFLELLGKDPADPITRFRFFAHKTNPAKGRIGPGPKIGGFNAEAIEAQHRQQRGAYVVVGHGGDNDASITGVPALFVEWDGKEEAWQLNAWRVLGLPEPSLMISTGGSSIHCYWLLHSPLDPLVWRPIQVRLIAMAGGDPSCCNPSRVMRLPGAWYVDGTGKAIAQTAIVHETEHRYDPADLVAAMDAAEVEVFDFTTPPESMVGVSIPTDDRQREFPIRTMQEIREALACIPQRIGGQETYKKDRRLLWGLIRACEQAGSTRDQAISLMEAHSPSVVSGWNVAQVGSYDFSQVRAESFWKLARLAGWVPKEERSGQQQRAQTGTSGPAAAQPEEDPKEPPPLSFRELLALVLEAVRAGDEDGEMEARAEIMARFRRTDGQITAALFRMLSQQEQDNDSQQQRPDYRSIDLSKVTGIDWLLEGFVPANDQALLYAPAGAGKTTAALGMAFAVTDGSGFLDRATNAPRGNVLLIASDSGTAPLIRSIQEMGRGDDPALAAGGASRLHVWAHDTEQAALAWEASLRGCLRLLEFVQAEQIALVLIDSCKAVTSKADLNYCDNGQVTALLTFFKEVLCQHCAVVWINHDGTGGGEAAGAKAWKEVPSAVHSIEMVPEGMDDPGNGVSNAASNKSKPVRFSTKLRSWKVRKCRQGTAREFMYRIDDETGCLAVCHTVEVIKDCRAAIVDLLAQAMNNGKASLHSRSIVEELQARFQYSQGTIRNGLTRVTGGKWPEVVRVPSLRGHYRLTHRMAEALSLDSDPP